MIVSMNGPSIATNPSLTGSFVFAAPCAIASVPVPASLEKTPLLIPIMINEPSAPPRTASPVNASLKINKINDGISLMCDNKIKTADKK